MTLLHGCSIVRYPAVRYCTLMQYSIVQYSTVQYSTVHAVQYSTVQYSTVQYSTVQCSEDNRGFDQSREAESESCHPALLLEQHKQGMEDEEVDRLW